MTGNINMNSNKIINLPTPAVNTDAATKKYVGDNFMNKNGGVFFGPMSLNNNALIGIPPPQYGYSAANKTYVDTEINKVKQNISSSGVFVKKSGDTMTGDLILPDYDYPIMGDLRKDIDYLEIFYSNRSFQVDD